MAVHQLKQTQFINADLTTVWRFFSRADNLQKITPEYMNFQVTSGELPEEIYPGQIITYKVAPVLHIPLFWMTEITHVTPNRMFVDEQRRGPYRFWHHQHFFEAHNDGVLMHDIVHYQLPFGILGEFSRILFVDRQLKDIFVYRNNMVSTFFGNK